MGESGSGKTTSFRNLDPKTTYFIDCDMKGMAWKGWREQYSTDNKNFYSTRDLAKIRTVLNGIPSKLPNIKTIVIDTLNTAMVNDEILNLSSGGYGKWVDLAQNVWNICADAAKLPDSLNVIISMHSETVRDDLGYTFTRIKTNGRKLEKVVLESLFSTVLLAKCVDGKYVFEVHANNSSAKSPYGAWDCETIDNDMSAVLKVLEEF